MCIPSPPYSELTYQKLYPQVELIEKLAPSTIPFNYKFIEELFTGKLKIHNFLSNLHSTQNILVTGHGIGNTAFFLSKFGHQVVGVDHAPTAVKVSRIFNRSLNLNCNFIEFDISNPQLCQLPTILGTHFDIVIDDHCLHCLTSSLNRINYLQSIYKILSAKHGHFILETMIYDKNNAFPFLNFFLIYTIIFSLGE